MHRSIFIENISFSQKNCDMEKKTQTVSQTFYFGKVYLKAKKTEKQ